MPFLCSVVSIIIILITNINIILVRLGAVPTSCASNLTENHFYFSTLNSAFPLSWLRFKSGNILSNRFRRDVTLLGFPPSQQRSRFGGLVPEGCRLAQSATTTNMWPFIIFHYYFFYLCYVFRCAKPSSSSDSTRLTCVLISFNANMNEEPKPPLFLLHTQ